MTGGVVGNRVWIWKVLNDLQKLLKHSFLKKQKLDMACNVHASPWREKIPPWKTTSILSSTTAGARFRPLKWASCYNPEKKVVTGIVMWQGHASFHLLCSRTSKDSLPFKTHCPFQFIQVFSFLSKTATLKVISISVEIQRNIMCDSRNNCTNPLNI